MVLFINNSYVFYFYHIEKGNFMELKQLEYFRAIVDAGTISGAARDLHMTQPPLSYQIKMLEEELQVPLFLRGKKRITLTEAGKTLYEQAGNLLMLSDLAKREVIKSSQSATLHIGMTPSTVSMMSDHLLHFAKKYPKVRFDDDHHRNADMHAACICKEHDHKGHQDRYSIHVNRCSKRDRDT